MKKGCSQFIAIVLMAVISFICGVGGSYVYNEYIVSEVPELQHKESDWKEEQSYKEPEIVIMPSEDLTVAEAIAEKVMPSVVGISTVTTHSYGGFFGFGGGYSYDSMAVGTGVIIDKAGYILTNSHVVNDGNMKSITVSLFDGADIEGKVLWTDAVLDLAVVKIEPETRLTAAELGDSDEMRIGSYAAAIGNPLGLNFERSMSQGIISGLDRSIVVSNGVGGSFEMEGLMQTDATINSGNSGGPLLNSEGEVIGINTAKAESGEGMGFAIPINVAKPIVEQIMREGHYERPYLGIRGISLQEQREYNSDTLEEYFGTAVGIYIDSVASGGEAEKAGLRRGDVITAIDGTKVGSMNKLNTVLVRYHVGDQVSLSVMRDKKPITMTVTLSGVGIFDSERN